MWQYSAIFLYLLTHCVQVLEDLRAIWEWILTAKLDIPPSQRTLYSAILVVPETFDNRGTSIFGHTLSFFIN